MATSTLHSSASMQTAGRKRSRHSCTLPLRFALLQLILWTAQSSTLLHLNTNNQSQHAVLLVTTSTAACSNPFPSLQIDTTPNVSLQDAIIIMYDNTTQRICRQGRTKLQTAAPTPGVTQIFSMCLDCDEYAIQLDSSTSTSTSTFQFMAGDDQLVTTEEITSHTISDDASRQPMQIHSVRYTTNDPMVSTDDVMQTLLHIDEEGRTIQVQYFTSERRLNNIFSTKLPPSIQGVQHEEESITITTKEAVHFQNMPTESSTTNPFSPEAREPSQFPNSNNNLTLLFSTMSPTVSKAQPTESPSQIPSDAPSLVPSMAWTALPETKIDQNLALQNDTALLEDADLMELERPSICNVKTHQCCINLDCATPGNLCVNRNCIEQGNPRFTLEWEGDDDLDLYVQTPGGTLLFHGNLEDPETGGRVAEAVDQFGEAFHVENIVFPNRGAPGGIYEYYVRPLITVDGADSWTLRVFDNFGAEIRQHIGRGFSDTYQYERIVDTTPTISPMPSPSPTTRRCSNPFDECCKSNDCLFSGEICEHRNCIDEGRPRFTLKWIGDDDLDLFVETPNGDEISFARLFDPLSGGKFGEQIDQFGSGYHVENVYFPEVARTPAGTYKFFVRPLISRGDGADEWTLAVVDDGTEVLSYTGRGISTVYTYTRQQGPTPSPAPIVTQPPSPTSPTDCSIFNDRCCADSDCRNGQTCKQRICIREGKPRFSLSWNGDDDIDLYVLSPGGVELNQNNLFDMFSGGRFEFDLNQNGFGMHIENAYFPTLGSPVGIYTYGVRVVTPRGAGGDFWTLEVFDDDMLINTQFGIGNSPEFAYNRDGGPDGPQRPRPPPPRCSPISDECCLNSDCPVQDDICVQRTCINDGNPRVSLQWVGDDFLNLQVRTPGGAVIFKDNIVDSATGGRFEQDGRQGNFDFHVQNVYFPTFGAPIGTYIYSVGPSTITGFGADIWTLQVYEDGEQVQMQTGIGGDSRSFTYQRMVSNTISPAPISRPTFSPVPPPTSPPVPLLTLPPFPDGCNAAVDECCITSDCIRSGEVCVQRTCINDGNPRIQLTWTGDDDLALQVRLPSGSVISASNQIDLPSGGRFGENSIQRGFGFHVENVYFQDIPGPLGIYQISVTTVAQRSLQDLWRIGVFEDGVEVAFLDGVGNSALNYERKSAPTPSAAPVGPPLPEPTPQRPLPTDSPVRECPHECCSTANCASPLDVCVQRTCIQEGNPRFTLSWTGNDDLSLVVVTPGGSTISFLNPFDGASQGVFGEQSTQNNFGFHVENVFFPLTGGPAGTYSFFVRRFNTRGNDDRWAVRVFIGGRQVDWQTGTGDSRTYQFVFDGMIPPTNAPIMPPSIPTIAPVLPPSVPTMPTVPSTNRPTRPDRSCLLDNECLVDFEVCIQRTCIDEGNPRFTLTWSGNDDLDLSVTTPGGVTISAENTFDPISRGEFGERSQQTTFGRHVENIFFPQGGGPVGTYTYFLRTSNLTGNNDSWTISVVVDGQTVAFQQGMGNSATFTYNFGGGIFPTPSPSAGPPTNTQQPVQTARPTRSPSTGMPAFTFPPTQDDCFVDLDPDIECCSDADCVFGNEVCVARNCVDEGNPRFTLSWIGDDDIDLVVMTPLGTVVSVANAFDAASGGIFGEPGDQFEDGFHAENIYFPISGGPVGTYSYFVRSFLPTGDADVWKVGVYVNGIEVDAFFGVGSSDRLTFEFFGVPATLPPAPAPSPSPCIIAEEECCTDDQCMTSIEICVQRTCIDRGNPRFTLTWTGDDDLDLSVDTPFGTTLSFTDPFDQATGGIYGEEGVQFDLDMHVENIYFPLANSRRGRYRYSVGSFAKRGSDDRWTVSVFVDDNLVATQSGNGPGGPFDFDFTDDSGMGVPTAAPSGCVAATDKCCDDNDCGTNEICTQDICIDRGIPRFTLTWTGDDDIDLIVVTPLETTISIANPIDEKSLGMFGEAGDQLRFGKHVENIFFPSAGGPEGVYTYFVSPFISNGQSDVWTVSVFIDDALINSQSGTGSSDLLQFEFRDGMGQVSANRCSLANDECCETSDCRTNEVCTQRTCIDKGEPRFILTWTGNDDLDLLVTAPVGQEISFTNQADAESGGVFGEDGVQTIFDLHLENIYFPTGMAPIGTYRYQISAFREVETPDFWTLRIFLGDELVVSERGSGNSGIQEYEYSRGSLLVARTAIDSCSPLKHQCCSDSDCVADGELCVHRTCIHEGAPRFTLTWTGDDDYDLQVKTPNGTTVSFAHPNDPSTGGFFGTIGSQFGFGDHVENIYFTPSFTSNNHRTAAATGASSSETNYENSAPYGLYTIQINEYNKVETSDQWLLQVYVGGVEVAAESGYGPYQMSYNHQHASIATSKEIALASGYATDRACMVTPESPCCTNAECGDQICVQQSCMDNGSFRISLQWQGSNADDELLYHLSVMTPDWTLLSSKNADDGDVLSAASVTAVAGRWSMVNKSGRYAMNLLLDDAAPTGSYTVVVETTDERLLSSNAGTWIVTIAIDGVEEQVLSGFGTGMMMFRHTEGG